MLNIKAIRDRLSEAPFTPFRLCLADGQRILVKHADYVAVGGSMLLVADDHDNVQRIDSLRIVSLDDVRQKKSRTESVSNTATLRISECGRPRPQRFRC